MLIHKVLHNDRYTAVTIQHKQYLIKKAKNGSRYITWDNKTFIVQDSKKDTIYAKQAKDGNHITWIMRTGQRTWGLIINDLIKRS